MSKTTLPLKLLQMDNVASLNELRARQRQIDRHAGVVYAAHNLKDRLDDWFESALGKDDTVVDYASHQKGLVVFSACSFPGERYVGENHCYSVSGELRADGKGLKRAEMQIGENGESISVIGYKRTPTKEIYTELRGGELLKLTLDHAKGTLQYEVPGDLP